MMRALTVIACAGCSNVLGIGDLSGPGSDAAGDSPTPDGPIPPGSILIAGTVLSSNTDGVASATVELVDLPPGIAGATTVSGADGAFQLVIDAGGSQIDGAALRASTTTSSELVTLAYFGEALSPDREMTDVKLQLFSDGSFESLALQCGVAPSLTKSVLIVFSLDAQHSPVPDVPIATLPGGMFCTDRNGAFSPTTDTGPSGVAFAFDVPVGSVTVISDVAARSGRIEPSTVTEVSLIQ